MNTADSSSTPGRARFAWIAAAAALALAAGAIGVVGGQSGPADGPEMHGGGTSAAPITTATPEVVVVHGGIPAAPTTTATPEVVAVWARTHEGWIFVYDDGRVLSHSVYGPVLERRLSPLGLALVRTRMLAPQDLRLSLSTAAPPDAWADPIPDAVEPARYAVCKLDADGSFGADGELGDVGSIWRRLPEDQQALFRAGRVLSFAVDSEDGSSAFTGQDGHHLDRGPGVACFVLSAKQTRAVWARTRLPGRFTREAGQLSTGDTAIAEPVGVADSDFLFLAVPLLPHGGGIFWTAFR
jgi:hypothetical protein